MKPHLIKPFEAIAVFLEKRRTRQYVGKLLHSKISKSFEFTYDESYLYAKNAIPLGPEFPLTRRVHRSTALFPSLQDRIPSRENPAYAEYCFVAGIDKHEANPIILLGTIGNRGPSSFIFEPIRKSDFSHKDLKLFRKKLGLTIREFALCFDLSQTALMRIENGRSTGRDLLKRIEIYCRFPEVAIFEIERYGGAINSRKRKAAINTLQSIGPFSA